MTGGYPWCCFGRMVMHADDEGYIERTGAPSISTGGIYLGNNVGNEYDAYAVISRLNVPQGATISAANLYVTANGTWSADDVDIVIAAHDADHGVRPANVAAYDSAARTTASVNVSGVPHQTDGTEYLLADVKTIVQEIVNRVGWDRYNAICFFLEDNGSDNNTLRVYGGSVGLCDACRSPITRLAITWS